MPKDEDRLPEEEIEHLQVRLKEYNHRLRFLQQEVAVQGVLNAPPEIIIEIMDLEQSIDILRNRIELINRSRGEIGLVGVNMNRVSTRKNIYRKRWAIVNMFGNILRALPLIIQIVSMILLASIVFIVFINVLNNIHTLLNYNLLTLSMSIATVTLFILIINLITSIKDKREEKLSGNIRSYYRDLFTDIDNDIDSIIYPVSDERVY
jgi:hypothetical protein